MNVNDTGMKHNSLWILCFMKEAIHTHWLSPQLKIQVKTENFMAILVWDILKSLEQYWFLLLHTMKITVVDMETRAWLSTSIAISLSLDKSSLILTLWNQIWDLMKYNLPKREGLASVLLTNFKITKYLVFQLHTPIKFLCWWIQLLGVVQMNKQGGLQISYHNK